MSCPTVGRMLSVHWSDLFAFVKMRTIEQQSGKISRVSIDLYSQRKCFCSLLHMCWYWVARSRVRNWTLVRCGIGVHEINTYPGQISSKITRFSRVVHSTSREIFAWYHANDDFIASHASFARNHAWYAKQIDATRITRDPRKIYSNLAWNHVWFTRESPCHHAWFSLQSLDEISEIF